MNGRKRTVQVKFRVTEEEYALIQEKMKQIPTRNMAALGKTLHSIRLYKHEGMKSISDNQRCFLLRSKWRLSKSKSKKNCYGFKNLNI